MTELNDRQARLAAEHLVGSNATQTGRRATRDEPPDTPRKQEV